MNPSFKRIVVVPYDPRWPRLYQEMAQVYQNHLGVHIWDVQHVGSTAVPGLAAKPILDIDLIVKNAEQMAKLIPLVEALGYRHRGDLGIPGRESFKALTSQSPTDGSGQTRMRHHLYACVQGHRSLRNHIALRDYLRKHPEVRDEYGALKQQLARQYPNDIDAYIEGKTPFITSILQQVGFPQEDLRAITKQNQKA